VVGVAEELGARQYLADGRPVYTSSSAFTEVTDEETIERLRIEFTAQVARLTDNPDLDEHGLRLRIAQQNLAKLDEVKSS
jgi:hypothetical protein